MYSRELVWTASTVAEDEIRAAFVDHGYTGLSVKVRGLKRPLRSLDFVRDLPGLTSLSIECRVADDSAAFDVASLIELTLLTGCRTPIPRNVGRRLPSLKSLTLSARPQLGRVTGLSDLESLFVVNWGDPDLSFLMEGLPRLSFLRLQGRKQDYTLDGVENCTALQTLWVDGGRLTDLRPVVALSDLNRLNLIGVRDRPNPAILDLAPLSRCPRLRQIGLPFAGTLTGLQALNDLLGLTDLRLRGTVLAEPADRDAVEDLPQRVTIVWPDE